MRVLTCQKSGVSGRRGDASPPCVLPTNPSFSGFSFEKRKSCGHAVSSKADSNNEPFFSLAPLWGLSLHVWSLPVFFRGKAMYVLHFTNYRYTISSTDRTTIVRVSSDWGNPSTLSNSTPTAESPSQFSSIWVRNTTPIVCLHFDASR